MLRIFLVLAALAGVIAVPIGTSNEFEDEAGSTRFVPRPGQCECPTHFTSIWQQCPCRVDALLRWMQSNGAVFPNIEYRDGGMFATANLSENALLAYVPTTMVLTHVFDGGNTTIPGLAAKLHEVAMDPGNFFRPYVEALPWACQTPHCGATPWPALNLTETPLFQNVLMHIGNITWDVDDAVEQSLALSRRWNFGLVPGMDLFNHDNAANAIVSTPNGKAVLLQAHRAYAKGDEVFISYGTNKGAAVWAGTYNMQHSSSAAADSECITQLSFFPGSKIAFNTTARVECFSALNMDTKNFERLGSTLKEALRRKDLAAVKGIAHTFASQLAIAT